MKQAIFQFIVQLQFVAIFQCSLLSSVYTWNSLYDFFFKSCFTWMQSMMSNHLIKKPWYKLMVRIRTHFVDLGHYRSQGLELGSPKPVVRIRIRFFTIRIRYFSDRVLPLTTCSMKNKHIFLQIREVFLKYPNFFVV